MPLLTRCSYCAFLLPTNNNFWISRFQAAEAKILRVSVTSFYDYLTVSLKCLQEFDSSLHLR